MASSPATTLDADPGWREEISGDCNFMSQNIRCYYLLLMADGIQVHQTTLEVL